MIFDDLPGAAPQSSSAGIPQPKSGTYYYQGGGREIRKKETIRNLKK